MTAKEYLIAATAFLTGVAATQWLTISALREANKAMDRAMDLQRRAVDGMNQFMEALTRRMEGIDGCTEDAERPD